MVDPVLLGAIGAVLGAVGSGMAKEAGKWAWESAGGRVRRIAEGEVTAPTTPGQLDDVARLVHERAQRDPQLAREWLQFAAGVRAPGSGSGSRRPCLPTAPHFFTDRQKALKDLDKEATPDAPGRRSSTAPKASAPAPSPSTGGWRQTARFPTASSTPTCAPARPKRFSAVCCADSDCPTRNSGRTSSRRVAAVTLWTTRSTLWLRPRVARRAASSPIGTRIHPAPATASSASRHPLR
ncbi:MAG: hypothetical protein HOY76_40460 [Streptomyces sp.]|nr:hypothetical protein [Streptomyces sp.]